MNIRKISVVILAGVLAVSLLGCVSAGTTATPSAGAPGTEASTQATQPTQTQPTQTETAATAQTDPTSSTQTAAAAITQEDAIAIALAHAGLQEADVTRLKAEYEIDRGVPEYDVEFDYGGVEYEYAIHAETGEILHLDQDRED